MGTNLVSSFEARVVFFCIKKKKQPDANVVVEYKNIPRFSMFGIKQ